MGRFIYPAVCAATATMTLGVLAEGIRVEAGAVPESCPSYAIGHPVDRQAEQALVDAGFSGITADGQISNSTEQLAVYSAQESLQENGYLSQSQRICGYAGGITMHAAKKAASASSTHTTTAAPAPQSESITTGSCSRIDEYTPESIRAVQQALGVFVDGKFGPKTCAALLDFQDDNGLSQYGRGALGPRTARELGVTLIKVTTTAKETETTFEPKTDCPKANSCDVRVDLTTQTLTIVDSNGELEWSIPIQSGKAGNETRTGHGTLGRVEYGKDGNPERPSIDYPEAILVNPRGFGNGGQKFHGSYAFSPNSLNNPNRGSAGCIRMSNQDSFIFAELPAGTDVFVDGAKPGTQQKYFN